MSNYNKLLPYTIGIIGGNGRMGRFFQKMFENDDIHVLISDLNTEIDNKEVVKKSHIIIVSVPIDATTQVLQEIVPLLRSDQLLMDVTSIKAQFIEQMLLSKADVIGMHPMFGPSSESMDYQTLIFIPSRDRSGWMEVIGQYFKKKNVKIKITTPDEHDKMMSVIQVLIHLSTIVTGVTMSRLGWNIYETLEYTSPIYRMELAMISRLFAQNARLYGNIPMFNQNTGKVIQEYKTALEDISKLILTKNLDEFIDLFNKTANYFEEFKEVSMKETDYLITKLIGTTRERT